MNWFSKRFKSSQNTQEPASGENATNADAIKAELKPEPAPQAEPALEVAAETSHKQGEDVLDKAIIAAAKDAMKDKFSMIVDYYIEDGESYVEQILAGVKEESAQAIVAPAHTLKSSSREMGALRVADLADALEKDARLSVENGTKIENLADRSSKIKAEFTMAKSELLEIVNKA